MNDQRWTVDIVQLRQEIVVAQTCPDRLLRSSHDPKWCEILRLQRVCEIPRNADLERALPETVRIRLTQTGSGEISAEALDCRSLLTTSEFLLE